MDFFTTQQRILVIQTYYEDGRSKKNRFRKLRVYNCDSIASVSESVEEDPNMSIRHRAQQIGLCPSTTFIGIA